MPFHAASTDAKDVMRRSVFIDRLSRDAHGATAVEYALMLGLIVLVLFGGISAFGNELQVVWNNVNTQSQNATQAAVAGA